MAKKSVQPKEDMSLDEARAYRASLYKPKKAELTAQQKREKFKIFWAQSRKKYNKPRKLEDILWLHLSAIGCDDPEKFEQGIAHFGLKQENK